MKTPSLLCFLALMPFAAHAANVHVASSANHQAIKAEVQDKTPSHFTINLKKVANMGVNQNAKTFAMYTGASVPNTCGDFSKIDINYKKPDKYHRVFDLSKNPEVLTALDEYGCVIITNKPKLPPAKS